MSLRRSLLLRGALVVACAASSSTALGQVQLAGAGSPLATRAWLESQAATAHQQATAATKTSIRVQHQLEERVLRRRLADGDFAPGDLVLLEVLGEPALSDTFSVRTGRTITLPGLGDVPLTGVLRSELQDHVTRFIAKYIREPNVRTSTLVRLAVLGAVLRPGFHLVPPDTPLPDVLMRAGGPAPTANFDLITVRRSDVELWNGTDVRQALGEGLTVDHLGLQSGDEILIGERKPRNYAAWIASASALTGVFSLLFTLSRSR
jgi:protein involved in polysaccharide export with SLBB domain